jgi:uncharacterized membrane protein
MPRTAPVAVLGRTARSAGVTWVLVAAAVGAQIVYPLVPGELRTEITVGTVLVFCAASLADAGRLHGARGAATLLAVAGGGGLLAETVGVRTGFPFGDYAYTGDLGPELFGVPVVVPLAWTMMAWPALVVGRTLAARGRPVVVALAGGWALAVWDLFLDPQMVDAGHWSWAAPEPALPLVPGVPLTNYAGWLLVSVLMVGLLHRLLDPHERPSGPAAVLYLWTFGSSVVAHVAFFDRPGSALVGGIVMGTVAVPFALALRRPPPARTERAEHPTGG